jgi:hypothetical protein
MVLIYVRMHEDLLGDVHLIMFYVQYYFLIQILAARNRAWIRPCKPFVHYLQEVCKVNSQDGGRTRLTSRSSVGVHVTSLKQRYAFVSNSIGEVYASVFCANSILVMTYVSQRYDCFTSSFSKLIKDTIKCSLLVTSTDSVSCPCFYF